MAEAEGGINVETQRTSMQMSALPRDLLQTVNSTGNHFPGKCEVKQEKLEVEEDEEEIELSLGLSLNGRFGVDPTASTKMKLTRSSSSKPEFMNPVKKDENDSPAASGFPQAAAMMSRTCSLPVETEEEWRKRKEIQSLRRMEAKRKRTEKQRNSYFRGAKDEDRAELEEDCEEGVMPINGNYKYMKVLNEFPNSGSPNWVRGAGGGGGGGGFGSCEIESKGEKSKSNGFEVLPPQGMNKCTESRSPANMPPLLDQTDQKPAVTPATRTATEKPGACTGAAPAMPAIKNPTVGQNGTEEMVRDVMLGMPCVTTKGDGPNGKRIQGLLYPYRKGEDVRIVCVCHGSFLSPAEFVKHGGGGDVENPLKHIVVNPSSLL